MGFRLLAAVAMLAAASPAVAGEFDFSQCDGYPAPRKKSDGITSVGKLFGGTAAYDYRRNQGGMGKSGIAACDRALADPLLLPEHWLRRAHLIQAKALHQLVAGSLDEAALKTLDESDAVGAERGAMFADSIALGNQALRAMLLYRLGKPEEAGKALAAIETARPYSVSLRSLARNIRLTNDKAAEAQMAALRHDAVFDPRLFHPLMWFALLRGDFADALAVSREVTFDLPRGRGGWVVEGAATRPYEVIGERAEMDGAIAYALSALGRKDEARARMARARQDLVDAQEAPPINPRTGTPRKEAIDDYERRVAAATKAGRELDAWEKAIDLRAALPGMKVDPAVEALGANPAVRDLPVTIDLLRQIKTDHPLYAAQLRNTIAEIERSMDEARASSMTLKYSDLAEQLPRPETEAMRPKLERERGAFEVIMFGGGLKGFSVRQAEGSDLIDISYGNDQATTALVEETAFLAAANQARKLGKDGFVVVSSQLVQRTLTTYTYYGSSSYETPQGYELRLKIRPLSLAALPADVSAWRVIKVEDVFARLADKFPARAR